MVPLNLVLHLGHRGKQETFSALLSPAYEVQAANAAKIVPRSPAAGSGVTWSICAHRAATGEGLVAVAAGSWRIWSNSTSYCHRVEYFIGHQHGDIFMAIIC